MNSTQTNTHSSANLDECVNSFKIKPLLGPPIVSSRNILEPCKRRSNYPIKAKVKKEKQEEINMTAATDAPHDDDMAVRCYYYKSVASLFHLHKSSSWLTPRSDAPRGVCLSGQSKMLKSVTIVSYDCAGHSAIVDAAELLRGTSSRRRKQRFAFVYCCNCHPSAPPAIAA